VSVAFKDAIDKLFALSQDASGAFFARYPELEPLYVSYSASADPIDVKRSKLLAAFRPALSRLRKQQQAVQRLSAGAVVDLPLTQALVNPAAAPFPLHAGGDETQPALNDVLASKLRVWPRSSSSAPRQRAWWTKAIRLQPIWNTRR